MITFFNRIFESRLLFALTLLLIIYGLFFVPNDNDATRTWTQIWNLGHVGAFIIVWLFIFSLSPRLKRLSASQLIFGVCVSTLLVGALIEWLQSFVGRDAEVQDVVDSGVGALLAVTFFSAQVQKLAAFKRIFLRVVALIVLVLVPWPVWSALADEIYIWRQVPVLSDFSTPFEMSRWHASVATIHLQKDKGSAHPYLAIEFRPATYSTVTLEYFYSDWRAYKRLVLDVTNPESTDLHVILRIHDRLHKRHHYAFDDRFNRALLIKPGRQRITIATADVKNAPASRKMDMQHIEELGIFTMQSGSYHHLVIHQVYLE